MHMTSDCGNIRKIDEHGGIIVSGEALCVGLRSDVS
jgi:hypothetical protein